MLGQFNRKHPPPPLTPLPPLPQTWLCLTFQSKFRNNCDPKLVQVYESKIKCINQKSNYQRVPLFICCSHNNLTLLDHWIEQEVMWQSPRTSDVPGNWVTGRATFALLNDIFNGFHSCMVVVHFQSVAVHRPFPIINLFVFVSGEDAVVHSTICEVA